MKTELCVGPVSKNVVDVALDLAGKLNIPICLIATRRQIECEELGKGYVHNWNTKSFVRYVHKHDTSEHALVRVARDHGGPFQGIGETGISHAKAMENAIISYDADIRSGFDMVHLDPSLGGRPLKDIYRDIEILFAACQESLKQSFGEIEYEVGTEEHNGNITELDKFEEFAKFCSELSRDVAYIVGNTGTYVKETRNVGIFDEARAAKLVEICNKYYLSLKEHNLDYVSEEVLKLHPKLGIHAANVAPEFGVVETRELLRQLQLNGFHSEKQRFLEIAYNSKKWDKWMIGDKERTHENKAVICGHYVFSYPEVEDMLGKIQEKIDLRSALRDRIASCMTKYLVCFGW